MPCKHLAATFYLLAEAFDDDPFLILRWRGREREALLGRLRELRADGPVDGTGRVAEPAPARRHRARPGRAGRSPRTERIASGSPAPAARRGRAVLHVEPDLMLRQLPMPGRRAGRPGAGRDSPGRVPALRCGGVAMARQDIEVRVRRVTEQALAEQHYVRPVDVLLGLGWLAPTHVDEWRQGRVAYLEGAALRFPRQ